MARETISSLTTRTTLLKNDVDELQNQVAKVQGDLNNQLADLEKRVDELESGSVDQRKIRGRQMTEEQRKEAGRRLQQARAEKLGLDSIEQLRALKLRPGQNPTKAQIKRVKEEHPAS